MAHIKKIDDFCKKVNEKVNPTSDSLQSGTIYMTVRVDYTFDGNITYEDSVLDEISSLVNVDSKANGLEINEVEFCGWNDADNIF